jgi:prevent-host-death family protein
MRELSIREARNSLSHIEALLGSEKEIIITRRGRPVAKLVSLRQAEVPSHAELRAETPRLERESADLIREERDR